MTMKILLADGRVDTQVRLRSAWTKDPNALEVSSSGLAALERFKLQRFDVVLISSELADLNYVTVAQRIREWETGRQQSPVTILVVTPTASRLSEEALAAGCTDVIQKSELLESFAELMEYVVETTRVATTWGGKERTAAKIVVQVDKALKDLAPKFLEQRRGELVELVQALKSDQFDRIRVAGQ